jgi:hypothetical protein
MRIAGAFKTFGVVAALAFAVAAPYKRVTARDSSPVQSAEEGKVTDGLQLLIDTEKGVFVQDEPVMVNFRLKNFRPEALNTSTRNSALNSYAIEVIDGSGRRVAARDEDRRKEEEATGKVRYTDGGYKRYLKIQPGDEQSESMDLKGAYSRSSVQ